MSGIWLKNGMHYNISDEGAKEIAAELRKNGFATFLGSEVVIVLPRPSVVYKKIINNSKILRKNGQSG